MRLRWRVPHRFINWKVFDQPDHLCCQPKVQQRWEQMCLCWWVCFWLIKQLRTNVRFKTKQDLRCFQQEMHLCSGIHFGFWSSFMCQCRLDLFKCQSCPLRLCKQLLCLWCWIRFEHDWWQMLLGDQKVQRSLAFCTQSSDESMRVCQWVQAECWPTILSVFGWTLFKK